MSTHLRHCLIWQSIMQTVAIFLFYSPLLSTIVSFSYIFLEQTRFGYKLGYNQQ